MQEDADDPEDEDVRGAELGMSLRKAGVQVASGKLVR